jgi:formylglycine-generating enzyme required for sulfatase activity
LGIVKDWRFVFDDGKPPRPTPLGPQAALSDAPRPSMPWARQSVAGGAGAKELTLELGNGATLKLIQIPAGKFFMGSSETAKDRSKDEIQHEVTISKAFYMGVTHVTVDQFAAFVKDSGYKTDAEKEGLSVQAQFGTGGGLPVFQATTSGISWRNLIVFSQNGDHPVVQVSWNDAQAFCTWLSKKSGKTVVLPTEAQWEYACRAGTTTVYPWGDNPDDGKGWTNCADQSLKRSPSAPRRTPPHKYFSWDDGFGFTSPVRSFKANNFGLYDMIGNTWQWCSDWYGDYDRGSVTDPKGADTGKGRVARGGSWDDDPPECRSAYRNGFTPDDRHLNVGFRVAVAGVD